ncbi:hypothetical protein [Nocardia salmonicida]|uniref:hypothetical protein n=1 Tax=Nocardia salmonicida TaxID=53431 RepID=UPI003CFA713E
MRARSGSRTATPLVLLDLEILIDVSAEAARGHLPSEDDTVSACRTTADVATDRSMSSITSYVGTVTGLYDLIRDLHALAIADGVLLIPLTPDPTVDLVTNHLPPLFTAPRYR